jgi:hypothetical protein
LPFVFVLSSLKLTNSFVKTPFGFNVELDGFALCFELTIKFSFFGTFNCSLSEFSIFAVQFASYRLELLFSSLEICPEFL